LGVEGDDVEEDAEVGDEEAVVLVVVVEKDEVEGDEEDAEEGDVVEKDAVEGDEDDAEEGDVVVVVMVEEDEAERDDEEEEDAPVSERNTRPQYSSLYRIPTYLDRSKPLDRASSVEMRPTVFFSRLPIPG
jgi:hypothetical protein